MDHSIHTIAVSRQIYDSPRLDVCDYVCLAGSKGHLGLRRNYESDIRRERFGDSGHTLTLYYKFLEVAEQPRPLR